MQPLVAAARQGTHRGLLEFRRAFTNLSDMGFYVAWLSSWSARLGCNATASCRAPACHWRRQPCPASSAG